MKKVYLFSTPFCGQCPGVKKQMIAKNISFEEVNAIKQQDMAKKYDIRGVPTIVVDDENGDWTSYRGNQMEEMISGL